MDPGMHSTGELPSGGPLAPIGRRYRLLPGGTMPAPGTVLRRGTLQACALIDQAQEAARLEREALRLKAEAEAEQRAQRMEKQAQSAALAQAAQLIAQLEQAREDFFQQAEELLLRIAREGLRKLLLDVPDMWQDRSSVRLLLREFRETSLRQPAALHLRPEALGDVRQLEPNEAWAHLQLVADDTLAPGQCLLRCGQGDLRADYLASTEALYLLLDPRSSLSPPIAH